MRWFAPWLVLGVGAVVYVAPFDAYACSCAREGPGRYYVGPGNTLPRYARGIAWAGMHPLVDVPGLPVSDRVTLLRHDDGRMVPTAFRTHRHGAIDLIVPDAPSWDGGDTYTVTVRDYSPFTDLSPRRDRKGRRVKPALPYSNEITVRFSEVELDLRGAVVQLSPRARQKLEHAEWRTPGCGAELEADTIHLTVVLPPGLEPWRDYLRYDTWIDGAPYDHSHPLTSLALRYPHLTSKCQHVPPGRTWTESAGTDRLFSECGEQTYGLAPGEHRLIVMLTTPDGAASFTTPETSFRIGCDEPEPAPAAAPPPSSPPLEPEQPAGLAPGPPPAASPRGCTASGSPAPLALVLLLLLPRRRPRAAPRGG